MNNAPTTPKPANKSGGFIRPPKGKAPKPPRFSAEMEDKGEGHKPVRKRRRKKSASK